MPRYFFDTSDGSKRVKDEVGLDYDDAEAARKAALSALPDMARDKLPDGDQRTFTVSVRDDVGTHVYGASLRLRGRWAGHGGALDGVADVLIEALDIAQSEGDEHAAAAIRNVLTGLGESLADKVGHRAAGLKLN